MQIPNIDCMFYSGFGKCSHLDMGKGFLWLGKSCILIGGAFAVKCGKMVPHPRPKGPPPLPLRKRANGESGEINLT